MPAIAAAALLYFAPSTALAIGISSSIYFFAAVEAISIVGSYLAYQSAKKGGRFDTPGAGALVNTRSAEEVLPVLYGRHRIGGNQVYVHATGENNKFLHIIQTISEGPIEGIEQVYLDDKPASEYGSLVYYEFFNGAGNQGICTTLQGVDPDWDDYLRWTSYLYIRLEYNAEKFTGLPKITVVGKGRRLYDPRNGITAYSDNPALVVYDWLTSKRYGLGLDTSLVDTSSIIDAANWFESQTVPFTFNGVIGQRQAFLDNLTDILVNCRSDIIWSEGKYKLLVRKYDTPVMSLTEDDIIADSFNLSVPGLADTPNRVIVKYPDESQTEYDNWVAQSYYSVGDKVSPTTANGFYFECIDAGTTGSTEPAWVKKYKQDTNDGSAIWRAWPADLGWAGKDQVIEDPDAVLLYDNEERDLELNLIGTTNAEQANLLGIYNLERSRLNKAYNFIAHPRCLALDPGDMIQVTHSLVGWENRVVRVVDIKLSQDGVVGLTVLEEDEALYDDTLNLSTHTYFRTNLPDPLEPVSEATGVSFAEEEYFNKDVSYTRLKVSFTNPTSPFWDYSEVWVNVNNAGYNHYTDARGQFTIEPVKEGVNYKVKLLSVSIQGVRQDISTATEWSYDVVGKNVAPDDVQNFRAIPQSDSVILMWDAVNIVDLQGYEIRRGTNWNSGIFLGFTRAVSYAMNGVAPGTHSYMIKSVDTNGKYSTGFALASATVYGPASYTEKMSESNDFSSGTHDDTEAYDDPELGIVLRVAREKIGVNPGFETGDYTGWNGGAQAYRMISDEDARRGTYSQKLIADNPGTNIWTAYKEIDVDITKTYLIRSWSRVTARTAGTLQARVAPRRADSAYLADIYYGTFQSVGGWIESRCTIGPPGSGADYAFPAETAKLRLDYRWTAASTGIAYVDEFSLIQTDLLTGTYTSPTYDRGSIVTRRCWPQFDVAFVGTGTTWQDQFDEQDLWTDVFGEDDTWLTLFGALAAGKIRMRLGYSNNGTSWSWVDYLESYTAEVSGRYVKFSIELIDEAPEGFAMVRAPLLYKEAFWL